MPINIPDGLPATVTLDRENIFYMTEQRAHRQDIRPLRIALLNLMPTKIETETQLLRLLGNTPLQVDIEFLQTASHQSKHTPNDHLVKFYKTFYDVRDQKFDGMVITGAPVEMMSFEVVDYWEELTEIMEWSRDHVYSTFHICWGAQAGLYYHYGVNKHLLDSKMFGVFRHRVLDPTHPLLRGFDEIFWAPHSRHTTVLAKEINQVPALQILADSEEAGVYIAASRDGRQFFVTGHSEYDSDTLAGEYFRDLKRGLPIDLPRHYFPDNDPANAPPLVWRGHSSLLFANWLNYFVYQQTPFDLERIQRQ